MSPDNDAKNGGPPNGAFPDRILSRLGESVVFYALNPEGEFVYASPGAALLFGITPRELLGRAFAEATPLDTQDAKNLASARARLAVKGGEICLTCRIRRPAADAQNSRTGKEARPYLLQEWASAQGAPGAIEGFLFDLSRCEPADAALASKARLYQTMLEHAPVGLSHLNDQGVATDCNERFAQALGARREDYVGFDVLNRIKNEDVRYGVQKALQGEFATYEGEYVPVLGNRSSTFRIIFTPVTPGRSPSEAIIMFEDISEARRAQAALQESEKRHRIIFENAPLAMVHFSRDGTIINCNDAFVDLMGSSREALIGFNAPRKTSSEDLRKAVLAAISGEKAAFENEFTSVTGGKTTHLRVVVNPVTPGASQTEAIATFEEITERFRHAKLIAKYSEALEDMVRERTVELTKANERLRRNESNLALAQKMAHFGSWTYDIKTDRFHLSREMANIHGTEAEYLDETELLGFIHPEDTEFVVNSMKKLISGAPVGEIECRIIRSDGEIRVLRVLAEITARDAQGVPLEVAGTVHDVTERRLAEDQFELARRIFDNAVEGVIVTDATGAIQFVNKGFTQITGYEASEVIGKNPRILKSDRHGADFYNAMWERLRETGSWEGEIWNRRKNGEAYPEWLSITAIPDAQGRPSRYVSVFHDVSELWKRDQELLHQASHDLLTGLPNRSLFLDRLKVAISHARREGRKIVVVILDLDNFQTINDALGHPAGDRLLQKLTGRLSIPASWEGSLARPGGDEFLFFLENADDDDIPNVTNWFFSAFDSPFSLEGRDIFITASLGVAVYPADGTAAEDLVKNADLALHQSKQFGRNTYSLYRPELNERISKHLELGNDLRLALEREEIVIHYQPQVDSVTGRTMGMEALVRWRRNGHLIPPQDFIPLAEETGLIVPIGEYVLREACRKLAGLRENGHASLRVSVNLSTRQFREESLTDRVASALAETGLPAHMLELEITESALVDNTPAALDAARRLSDMGVLLALDDFGTGYSSLSYLRMFPIKCLKIDKSFVDDIPDDPEANALVNAVIAMARSLGLIVVAEGVETDEQLWYLREQKCELIQGFRVSKPLPDGEIDAFLRDNPQFALFRT